MDDPSHPYVYRGEPADSGDGDGDGASPDGADVVIVDGRAMSYRWYRR